MKSAYQGFINADILVKEVPQSSDAHYMVSGTGCYFLFIGTWFDGLATGMLCLGLGVILGYGYGYGYIKLIEEHELQLRFCKFLESIRSSVVDTLAVYK